MSKKGYTTIEIILSLALISIVGMFFLVFNKKEDTNKIKNLTENILKSALVYANVEKDEDGINYSKGIASGGKGIRIPLNVLVDTGYVKENEADIIKNTVGFTNENDYYVLLALNKDLCENGSTITLASWDVDENNKTIYLCDNKPKTCDKEEIIKYIDIVTYKDISRLKVKLNKFAVSETFFTNYNGDKSILTDDENGIFTYYNENSNGNHIYYYYRGAVDNNYVEFAGHTWRIVWLRDDNRLKLVLNDTIPIYVYNTKDEKIYISDNDSISCYSCWFSSNSYNLCGYLGKYGTDDLIKVDSLPSFNEETESTSPNEYGYYSLMLKEWYSNTLEDNYEKYLVTKNNFCIDTYYAATNNNNYTNDTNYECYTGTKTKSEKEEKSFPVMLLNYSELIRAGLSTQDISIKPDNYLLENSANFALWLPGGRVTGSSSNTWKSNYGSGYNVINGKIVLNQNYSSISSRLSRTELGSVTLYDRYGNIVLDNNCYTTYKVYTFIENSIKPAIIIDLNKVDIINSLGTSENPFKLLDKDTKKVLD